MKTSELIGPALDWAVAVCQNVEIDENNEPIWFDDYDMRANYSPSTNWSDGGPIIDQERIAIEWTSAGKWRASVEWLDEPSYEGFGPTPLVAAMRCYVASKLGDEVEIPEQLT